jgi:hypothetical protein
MDNIIILGQHGAAGKSICAQLEVDEKNIFSLSSAGSWPLLQQEISEKVKGIGTLNWIGHGSANRLILDGDAMYPKMAAEFFQALAPEKIVLWSCNTGLCSVKGDLRDKIWAGYTGSDPYTKTDDFKYTTIQVTQNKIDKKTGKIVWDSKTKRPEKETVNKKVESDDYKKYKKSPDFRKNYGEMNLAVTAAEMGDLVQSV